MTSIPPWNQQRRRSETQATAGSSRATHLEHLPDQLQHGCDAGASGDQAQLGDVAQLGLRLLTGAHADLTAAVVHQQTCPPTTHRDHPTTADALRSPSQLLFMGWRVFEFLFARQNVFLAKYAIYPTYSRVSKPRVVKLILG